MDIAPRSSKYGSLTAHIMRRRAWNGIKGGWRSNRRSLPHKSKSRSATATACRKLLYEHVRLFGEEATLHGLRYIASPKSWLAEKLLWSAVFIICVTVATIMMKIVWTRFGESPTVTTVETTTYPIWNIPFPAVTLCNNNKVYKSAAHTLAKNFSERLPMNSSTVLAALKLLPALIIPKKIDSELAQTLQEVLLGTGYNIPDLMLQLSPPCKTFLVKCMWLDVETDCSDLFQVSKSAMGICCSFNYNGVNKDLRLVKHEKEGKIHHAIGAGRHAGLTLVLDAELVEYFAPLQPLTGIWAMFHDPEDYPDTGLQTALVEPRKIVSVMLEAQVIESVDTVRRLNVNSRHCWFDDEVAVVQSSPSYSYQTCITECRMKVFQVKCGCVPFYYPLFDKSSRVCTLLDTDCLKRYSRVTSGLQPTSAPAFGQNLSRSETEGMNCTCLPQCTDKSYFFDKNSATSVPEFNDKDSIMRKISNASVLQVYFRGITCMKYARDAYMTWDIVFATFGGIFGLCMGGSVMSIFEIFYRLFLLIIAMVKTVANQRIHQPHDNVVLPSNIKTFNPQPIEFLFHRMRHENI